MSEPHLFDLTKEDALLHLLTQGLTMLHLDANHPDVEIPEHLRVQPVLRLNVSYNFNIPDFTIDNWGVSITLHFPNIGHYLCKIPWPALFGISSQVSQDGRMWPQAMPLEMRRELAQRQVLLLSQARGTAPSIDMTQIPEPEDTKKPKGPALAVIEGGVQPAPEAPMTKMTSDETASEKPKKKKKGGFLKLVK